MLPLYCVQCSSERNSFQNIPFSVFQNIAFRRSVGPRVVNRFIANLVSTQDYTDR